MIAVESVHKRFGKRTALAGVSFQARAGEITALLGANGSGKTTTLRTICGLLTPDRGRVVIAGSCVAANRQGARTALGVFPDQFGLYPRLTAREHLVYFARLHGLRGQHLGRAVDRAMAALHMDDIADRRTAGFSQGQHMKVALARALVHRPQHVILDEPTRGLDVMSIRLLRRILRDLRDQGCCIVFSSHVMAEVAELSDRVVAMAAGQVVADGTAAALIAQTGRANLEEAFVALAA